MNKKKVIAIIAGIVLVIGAVIGVKLYNDYNKKTENAGDVEADYKYSSTEFIEKFDSFGDDEKARKYFDDKVIQITGEVLSIDENGNTYDIILSADDPSIEINFNLIEEMKDKVEEYNPGDEVVVQGFYTGKNSSEEMMIEMINYEFNRAVIIE